MFVQNSAIQTGKLSSDDNFVSYTLSQAECPIGHDSVVLCKYIFMIVENIRV